MINSLKDVEKIGDHEIVVMDELRDKYPEKFNESGAMDYKWFESEIRPNNHIFLRHDKDSLTFNMMTKPASEGGKGCQLTVLIVCAIKMLMYFDKKFPCYENKMTLESLHSALSWQKTRTDDRIARKVEGFDKA